MRKYIIQIIRAMKAPVYIVKPKNIYRHPFNKLDLDKTTNRDSQNEDLTDYFNYGFNEDTMNIYSKLVKRNIQVLDESINPTYFDAPSELMRLNDQIPMDFGGFCKFFDTSVFVNHQGADPEEEDFMIDYHNGERLYNCFIYIATSKAQAQPDTYPLIDFVKCMYKGTIQGQAYEMCDVMDQIQDNLEKKYQDTMKKLYERKNNPGGVSNSNNTSNQDNDRNKSKKNNESETVNIAKETQNTKKDVKQEMEAESSGSSSSDSDSNSDSDSSSGSSSSDNDRKKKKSRKSGRSSDRAKKDKKSKKSKAKKISKDDRRDNKGKSKKSSKSRRKSRQEDRGRKNDKFKKRR